MYLDVDSDTGLRRIQEHRAHQLDRLDAEGLEFHQRVRHAYLKLAEEILYASIRLMLEWDYKMSLRQVFQQSLKHILPTSKQCDR